MADVDIVVPSAAGGSAHVLLFDSL